MQTPLVSVIIPVFNVEKYLGECLDSVLAQTLSGIEAICVDDASTDGSLAILREYEKRDARVRVIALSKNQGLPVARNAGMEVARGRYVYFLDSDDRIRADILEQMHEEAEASECDIVVSWGEAFPDDPADSGCCKRAKDMNRWICRMKPVKAKRLDFAEIRRDEMPCSAWAKLYRRDFLERNVLRFIGRKAVHEDEGFRVKLVACRPLVSCIPEAGYQYRIRNDSIMGSQKFEQERGSLLRVFADAIVFARERLSSADMQKAAPEINALMQRVRLPFVVSDKGVALDRRAFACIKYGLLSRIYRGHSKERCFRKIREAGEIPPLSPFFDCCTGARRLKAMPLLDRLLLLAGIRILGL